MELDKFWTILEKGKDSDEPEIGLKKELEGLSAEEIISFQNYFDEQFSKAYHWDLWGAAYLIHGGCSDDGFIDFRYALISKGREVYSKAVENPDSLADLGEKVESLDNELFGYVAGEVYESKTGQGIPIDSSSVSEGNMGQEWDFDDEAELRKRLPKLFAIIE